MFDAIKIFAGWAFVAAIWLPVLGLDANASLYIGSELPDAAIAPRHIDRRLEPVAGSTGHHPEVVEPSQFVRTVARPQRHHPEIVKGHHLPELRRGLFSSYNLERQSGCLAVAIYYEARGEEFAGQVAIGQVILNRVKSRKYPGAICEVVYQNAHRKNRCQFSFACDGRIDNPRHKRAWQQAMILANLLSSESGYKLYLKQILLMTQLDSKLSRSTHYHATYSKPIWRKRLSKSGRIGQHIFYISKRAWS